MAQIHISLVDNPPSRKLADVVVDLPAATIELNSPDSERLDACNVVLNVPAMTIAGIAIWSTPEGPVVTFPSQLIFPTSPDAFGWNLIPTQQPSNVPLRRIFASLVNDILTVYHDAKRTAP